MRGQLGSASSPAYSSQGGARLLSPPPVSRTRALFLCSLSNLACQLSFRCHYARLLSQVSSHAHTRTSYDDTHVHYGGAGATQLNASSYGARPGAAQPGMVQNAAGPATGANGADWRVQLADYASSRLKDEVSRVQLHKTSYITLTLLGCHLYQIALTFQGSRTCSPTDSRTDTHTDTHRHTHTSSVVLNESSRVLSLSFCFSHSSSVCIGFASTRALSLSFSHTHPHAHNTNRR